MIKLKTITLLKHVNWGSHSQLIKSNVKHQAVVKFQVTNQSPPIQTNQPHTHKITYTQTRPETESGGVGGRIPVFSDQRLVAPERLGI